DLVRGLLDGDGSILDITYNGTGKARGRAYRTLITRFNSASRPHLDWIRERLKDSLAINGSLSTILAEGKNPFFHLSYAMPESAILLSALYRDRSAPCLLRKRDNWDRWLALNNGAAPRLGSGSAR